MQRGLTRQTGAQHIKAATLVPQLWSTGYPSSSQVRWLRWFRRLGSHGLDGFDGFNGFDGFDGIDSFVHNQLKGAVWCIPWQVVLLSTSLFGGGGEGKSYIMCAASVFHQNDIDIGSICLIDSKNCTLDPTRLCSTCLKCSSRSRPMVDFVWKVVPNRSKNLP